MSGEPKTLTPGIEQRLTVGQVNALVGAIEQCWSHALGYDLNPSREGEAAMKSLRAAFPFAALGVPVVARDPAAELRAAAREAVQAYWDTTPNTADELETGTALRKAVINLSAALAATEEQS